MPSTPTPFDTFFQSITSGPEFENLKKAGDISDLSTLEKSLTSMQSDVVKANDLMKNLDTNFPSPS